ncbi:MAG: hydroxyisourate hydrolase [Proteobacteria bacterium]|jgi:5-hydroxyisourate hydrolase|nr:hydroxyisourate hydrolase [Alphaproteobacteria bacterium]MDA0908948.1 hydroxyisourate hydrolase [Pseudomonadota bacterium]MDA1320428.1 hydroxyisourate hydrolase [Pseudomonadota bacterium]NBR38946.1 hydroxyisourate hydrolase [Alphaproteobacteria bacterium]
MAKGFLTTHVLDTAKGCPAKGLTIRLYGIMGSERKMIRTMITNADGRTDTPILPQGQCEPGTYELVFAAGDYLRAQGFAEDILFLDEVPVRFGLADPEQHYHVPLLLSPYGYSTYRGS